MIYYLWLSIVAAILVAFAVSVIIAGVLAWSDKRDIKKGKTDHKTRREILQKLNPRLLK